MSRVVMLLFVLTAGLAAQSPPPASRPARPAPASAAKPTPAKPVAPAGTPAPVVPAAQAPQPPTVPSPPASVLTDEQKTIYALGLLMQRSIRQFDLSAEEIEIVKRALLDAASGTPAIDLNEWGPKIQPLATLRGERAMTREKALSAAYLERAATEIGAVKTASGLVYRDISAGTGRSPGAGDTVKVHYRGTLINGTVFDSSYDRAEPATFALGGVVPCWTEGVQRMKVGGKARLVCPSDLAYGDTGAPAIPGGAALVFEIELIDVVQ